MASQFSAFAPSGIRFTRRKPVAETIYETLREQWGSLFSEDPESMINTETFAQAKCLALAKEQLERAGNQANPRYCTELLPKLEADYQIVPEPGATIQQRRAALIAARAARGGPRLDSLRDGLTALLGDGLIAIVPQQNVWGIDGIGTGLHGVFPETTAPATGPGNFCRLDAPYKVIRITNSVFPGSGVEVEYTHVTGDSEPLKYGDVLCVDAGKKGYTERLQVVGVVSETVVLLNPAKVHEVGSRATTAAIPYWVSGKRFVHIVVSNSVLTSPLLTSRVHAFMTKAAVHSEQWALVASSGTGTAGPFVIGQSLLGQTPISVATY
jgi:hypothetical protein